ncbi:hypothetical protein SAMN05444372_106155 [Flavobacterium micromati]|uniref:Transcriptional regulator, AbiEi antitoxin, Type IV TA system n=1 Tax=Flavobacterium micromati TaxID=229205 RepID=A0A1M5K933_9FLAO|nr:hypothetical protein [Flavobacterium micromati]SHG48999.1 hypothetical protein SAMN05444372_106155 [Flavobacterium micromati]
MEVLRQHIKPGKVYRRSDLEYYSTAIDRHLAQLIKEGVLVKLSQGLYYVPKQSKFGLVPPDDRCWVESFLKDDDFLMVSPNSYNALGLGLTQLYNTTWVYNHKRKGEFKLNAKTFEFKIKSSFPNEISKEFLLVDLLNNLEEVGENKKVLLEKVQHKLLGFNAQELMNAAQHYGTGKTKQFLKSVFRNSLLHD